MNYIVFGFLMLAALSGCKKEDTDVTGSGLPDVSSVGKNFLACKRDGDIHIYSGKRSFGNNNGVDYTHATTRIVIYADDAAYNDALEINLQPNAVKVDSLYAFSSESSLARAFYRDLSYKRANPHFSTQDGSGWIRFSRLDDQVAAGTFEFTAYYDGSGPNLPHTDSVRITDGRFDIAKQ